MAERTADTMTTSLSFFARTAAFPDEVLWIDAITVMIEVGLGWERFINAQLEGLRTCRYDPFTVYM
jgi:hypothetical protein